jgi:hypothetical protein
MKDGQTYMSPSKLLSDYNSVKQSRQFKSNRILPKDPHETTDGLSYDAYKST